MRTENAELRVAELFRGAPDMALDQPLDAAIMPQLTARKYFSAIDELGSPVPSSTPQSLEGLPPNVVDQEMVTLFGPALKIGPDSQSPVSSCQGLDSGDGVTIDARVAADQSVMLKTSNGTQASISLGLMAPPSSSPQLVKHLLADTPVWVHMPDTGRAVVWRLAIQTGAAGLVQVCGAGNLMAHHQNGIYTAAAASGQLDQGWKSVADPTAYSGLAARIPAGTGTTSYRNAIFGNRAAIPSSTYDLWYRVKVSSPAGVRPEMTLGLFDITAWRWVAATSYRPSELSTDYRWVRVSTGLTTDAGHRVAFIAQFNNHNSALSTDWSVDEAVIQAAGEPAPSDVTPANG